MSDEIDWSLEAAVFLKASDRKPIADLIDKLISELAQVATTDIRYPEIGRIKSELEAAKILISSGAFRCGTVRSLLAKPLLYLMANERSDNLTSATPLVKAILGLGK